MAVCFRPSRCFLLSVCNYVCVIMMVCYWDTLLHPCFSFWRWSDERSAFSLAARCLITSNPLLMRCSAAHLHTLAIALQWSLSLSFSPSHPAVSEAPEGLAVHAAAGNRETQTARCVFVCVQCALERKMLMWHCCTVDVKSSVLFVWGA